MRFFCVVCLVAFLTVVIVVDRCELASQRAVIGSQATLLTKYDGIADKLAVTVDLCDVMDVRIQEQQGVIRKLFAALETYTDTVIPIRETWERGIAAELLIDRPWEVGDE